MLKLLIATLLLTPNAMAVSVGGAGGGGGSGSDSTKVPLAGGTMTGPLVANAGIIVSTAQFNGAINSTGSITTSSSMTAANLLVTSSASFGGATVTGGLTVSSLTALGAIGLDISQASVLRGALTVGQASSTFSNPTGNILQAGATAFFANNTAVGIGTTAPGSGVSFQVGGGTIATRIGFVGLGTTNPTYSLDVNGSGNGSGGIRVVDNARTVFTGAFGGSAYNYTGSLVGWMNYGAFDSSPIAVFYKTSTSGEIARITGSGLSINEGANPEQYLDVNGAAVFKSTIEVQGAANFKAAVTASSFTARGAVGVEVSSGTLYVSGNATTPFKVGTSSGSIDYNGSWFPKSYTKALIDSLVPSAAGGTIFCSNCATSGDICVSTGTSASQFRRVGTAAGCGTNE